MQFPFAVGVLHAVLLLTSILLRTTLFSVSNLMSSLVSVGCEDWSVAYGVKNMLAESFFAQFSCCL